MNDTIYKFNIGAFQCTVFNDGSIRVPGPLPPGFSGKPEDRPFEQMDIGCLLIESERRKILIDTGCGTFFQGTAGKLLENMRKENVNPDKIDTVIYTHAHPDHIGGTIEKDGTPVFKHARQVMTKKEWECLETASGPGGRMFTLAQKNLLPLRGYFDLFPDDAEIMPGIKLIPAEGHTLGGVMIEISSGNDKLICIGDLIHSQLEFTQPAYYSFLDSAPDKAVNLRTEGLSRLAEAGTLIFACHLPFPGIGRFVKRGGVLGWKPV